MGLLTQERAETAGLRLGALAGLLAGLLGRAYSYSSAPSYSSVPGRNANHAKAK